MEHASPARGAAGLGGIIARSRRTLVRQPVAVAGLPVYLAIALAAGAVWVANAGGVPDDHAALGFVVATTVLVLAGAAWLHGKSSRRTAAGLYSLAGVTALVALTAVLWLVLAFPSGRLHGVATYVFAFGVVLLLTTFVAQLLTAPRMEGLNPIAGCRDACPRNALAVTRAPAVAAAFARAEDVGLAVLAACAVAVLAWRVTRASSARRRTVLPIYVGAAAALSLAAAVDLAARFGNGVTDRLAIADSSATIFLPFGFLVSVALRSPIRAPRWSR